MSWAIYTMNCGHGENIAFAADITPEDKAMCLNQPCAACYNVRLAARRREEARKAAVTA